VPTMVNEPPAPSAEKIPFHITVWCNVCYEYQSCTVAYSNPEAGGLRRYIFECPEGHSFSRNGLIQGGQFWKVV